MPHNTITFPLWAAVGSVAIGSVAPIAAVATSAGLASADIAEWTATAAIIIIVLFLVKALVDAQKSHALERESWRLTTERLIAASTESREDAAERKERAMARVARNEAMIRSLAAMEHSLAELNHIQANILRVVKSNEGTAAG